MLLILSLLLLLLLLLKLFVSGIGFGWRLFVLWFCLSFVCGGGTKMAAVRIWEQPSCLNIKKSPKNEKDFGPFSHLSFANCCRRHWLMQICQADSKAHARRQNCSHQTLPAWPQLSSKTLYHLDSRMFVASISSQESCCPSKASPGPFRTHCTSNSKTLETANQE